MPDERLATQGAARDAIGDASGDAIVVDRLTRRFGDFIAVDAVTFAVREGEVFGFLGPNGAGKTTTIKMLTGLVRPSSGTGVVAGVDIATRGSAIKQRIGYMSQAFSLYLDLTVEENIAFAAGLHDVRGARFLARRDWVLAMAGLAAHRRSLVARLPLGWKQRLALGCAVLHEPAVLFLDEPTSGVDPVARRDFWDVIRDLADGGTTVLVSTHYMEEAEGCDRLALMNRGRLVALDTPAALRGGMHEPILRLDTSDAPRAVAALRESDGVIEASLFGRAVRVVVEEETRALTAARRCLAAVGITLSRIERVAPSLEDVFVSSVRRAGGAVVG